MAKHAFFYTDPVAALWMVKTFRMRLSAGTFCLQPESIDAFVEMFGRGVRHERYVVTSDSLPILEPKVGDIVEEGGMKTKLKRLVVKDFPLTGVSYEIIQRSGKPFFTPERTAA